MNSSFSSSSVLLSIFIVPFTVLFVVSHVVFLLFLFSVSRPFPLIQELITKQVFGRGMFLSNGLCCIVCLRNENK